MMERAQVISDGMAGVLRSLRFPPEGSDPAEACALALGVPGVAVSLLVGDGRMSELLWSFPELSGKFEDLQFTLGEGPGPDAVRTGVPVVEPDLTRVRADRWPALLPAAQELGVRGVNCFLLGVGAVRIGVLTVLGDGTLLSDQQYADAMALSSALTGAVLNGSTLDGDDRDLHAREGFTGGLHRAAVHQATGMISVQLDVPLAQALLRLRAHAYSSGLPLGDVAAEVVARRLRFDDDGDDMNGPHPPKAGKG
ncbi:ANTAR domain-containing protein [Streptomyces sp. BH055]|uniref:ANTAR domain-containing protein n=1 Tax=unclassified Streptomyces TaxID=2593676 RepID=UPI003BB583AF